MVGITIQRGLTSSYFHKQYMRELILKMHQNMFYNFLPWPNDKWKNGLLL